jgi:hypothetical protein
VESAEQLDEINFKKAAATALAVGGLAGYGAMQPDTDTAPGVNDTTPVATQQVQQPQKEEVPDYSVPIVTKGHLELGRTLTSAQKIYNNNVRALASSVTQAFLKDAQGKPVQSSYSDKWEIKEFVPGTGMARVQIQYVLNGKQTAQVQINWHEYKINAIGWQEKISDKQVQLTGFKKRDIRTLKEGTNEQLEEGIADKLKGAILGAAITFAAVNTDLDKVFVEPEGGWPRGSLFDFKATDRETNNTVAVVDTKKKAIVKSNVKSISDLEYTNLNATMNTVMADDRAIKGWRLDGGTLYITIKVNSPQYGLKHYGFDDNYAKHFLNNTIVDKVKFIQAK